MRVLIACEFSGRVRNAFTKKGHYAMSCDLLPTESDGLHYQGNILDVLNDGWDLMIAHPPCTFLCNSGVCHLYNKDGTKNNARWENMEKAAEFFRSLRLHRKIPRIAVENPIPHRYATNIIKVHYDQIIHPYQFGHTERKATCLWLWNLPKLKPTNDVKSEMLALPKAQQQRLHYLPPSRDRAKLRSTTFQGIADAFAEQWG